MRGLAVVLAATSMWVLAGGRLPRTPRVRLPALRPQVLGQSVAAGFIAVALTIGLTGALAVSVAVGALVTMAPITAGSVRAARERAAIADMWPDILASVRSRLAGGQSLHEAFEAAARRAGGYFDRAADLLESRSRTGTRFTDIIEELRDEMADPLSDRILSTLAAATHTGGARVSEIIGALGASVADELRLRKAHDAALTQQRMTAAVALVAPWALLVLTVSSNPQAAAVYRTATGSMVVVGGLVATTTGYALARRAARLAAAPRVFQ